MPLITAGGSHPGELLETNPTRPPPLGFCVSVDSAGTSIRLFSYTFKSVHSAGVAEGESEAFSGSSGEVADGCSGVAAGAGGWGAGALRLAD